MGGVDLVDMMIAVHKTPLRSKRWYLAIFAQLIDISIVNAWFLYRRDLEASGIEKLDKSKKFKADVVSALVSVGNIPKRGRRCKEEHPAKIVKAPVAPRPPDDVRVDNIEHLPSFVMKGRCRYCSNNNILSKVRCAFMHRQRKRNW
ncbi:Transposase IS4 [Popillia japonica]|uniref:Transposase IS4 n=1 Tax=Popillia japonica TaxID=7064 RepID=A0AAW1KHV8_POPJA